ACEALAQLKENQVLCNECCYFHNRYIDDQNGVEEYITPYMSIYIMHESRVLFAIDVDWVYTP
ncbi:MAG: hypothetical protein KDI49_15765, partial [Gammaproteobacteria bacterium]|nr:hypothetical protein [Gammaproteobacteria bacterium]